MNRKKKLNDAYNKKIRKLNDKLRIKHKSEYISKAELEKAIAIKNSLRIDDASLVSETQI